MTTSAERTIGLGHRFALAVIARELGLGEKREKRRHLPCGWFVSPSELEQVETERARRLEASRDERLARGRARAKCYAGQRPEPRPPRERALATWRQECADPQSYRSPEQAWAYARAATIGLAPDSPMPRETPPARLPRLAVVVEVAGRRDGGGYGRAETSVERATRQRRESRARARTPSCSTAGLAGRRGA